MKNQFRLSFSFAIFGAFVLAAGCSDNRSSGSQASDELNRSSARAVAKIRPTSPTSTVSGTVAFVEEGPRTIVTVSLSGATPGQHGMHIHQNGSCEAVDGGGGLGAGGHWNIHDAGHGLPDQAVHHLGDLGNITVDEKGNASTTISSDAFYVREGAGSVVGHAVIFHEKVDDGSQPTGNAGARPGCGVIEREDGATK